MLLVPFSAVDLTLYPGGGIIFYCDVLIDLDLYKYSLCLDLEDILLLWQRTIQWQLPELVQEFSHLLYAFENVIQFCILVMYLTCGNLSFQRAFCLLHHVRYRQLTFSSRLTLTNHTLDQTADHKAYVFGTFCMYSISFH